MISLLYDSPAVQPKKPIGLIAPGLLAAAKVAGIKERKERLARSATAGSPEF